MKKEISEVISAGGDSESEWFPLVIEGWKEKPYRACTLQISWSEMGNGVGDVSLRLSNDEVCSTEVATFHVTGNNNTNNVTIYEINTLADYLGFSYRSAVASNGKIQIIISYHNA